MDWFAKCFGFDETDYKSTQQRLLKLWNSRDWKLNGWQVGEFHFEELAVIRRRGIAAARKNNMQGKPTMEHVVGEARSMHQLDENEGAMFQVASQFNCLEFISDNVTPEDGITGYINDHTQGPACAVACGAAAAYRNYLVSQGSSIGQTADNQLNAMDVVFFKVNSHNCEDTLQYRNGYLDVNGIDALLKLNGTFLSSKEKRDDMADKIKVAAHYNTQVTDLPKGRQFFVNQCFGAAPAITYSACIADQVYWQSLSQTILDATYEASLWHTILSHNKTSSKRPKLLLTKVGGGVFGNHSSWICKSMQRMISIAEEHNLPVDIKIVHFGRIEEDYNIVKVSSQ